VFLIPDTPLGRRIATLGTVFIATVAVRLILALVRPELTVAQAAVAGAATVVLVAPPAHIWLGGDDPIPSTRRASYRLLCVFAAGAFLLFLGFGVA